MGHGSEELVDEDDLMSYKTRTAKFQQIDRNDRTISQQEISECPLTTTNATPVATLRAVSDHYESVKRKCPECSRSKLRRLFGAGAAIVFKGSGFYQTDYRSESYLKKAKAEKESSRPARIPRRKTGFDE